jgi:Mor family transcriptional regulator
MGKPSEPETKRNESIYKDFKHNMSYVDMVSKYRISSQRIWQIIKRAEKEDHGK